MPTGEENFYEAVVIACVVLGFVIVYFVITMIKHQRRNNALYRAKITAEISTLENERKRIAGDLHDELGPILSAVKLHLNHLQLEGEENKKIIEFSNKHINEIINKIREISYNLLPNTLIRNGLLRAIEEYIERLKAAHPLVVQLHCEGSFMLTKDKEINVYRMIQEIVHNTIKHAKASLLFIEFKVKQNVLYLTIADNGKGFNYEEKLKENTGLGLLNLQSRAEVINANFTMQSEPDKGTNYFLEIPL